jgi:hypothetical protein
MLLGHYGLAFAAKRLAPRASLGTLTLAAQLADEIWPILLLVGVEHVGIRPDARGPLALDFLDYPWSHSLLLQLIGGAALAGVYWMARRDGRAALVVGALVPSHWVLDFLVHRRDLPLWPNGPMEGLGGWTSIPVTLLLELLCFGGGLWMYTRTTEAVDRTGRLGLWSLVAVLLLSFAGSAAGPPPPDAAAIARTTLGLWLFVPWAYWVDRHRRVRGLEAAR